MKTKLWIEQLQKLDPEKELYFHYTENNEDWGYCAPEPKIGTTNLIKSKYEDNYLIYDNDGLNESGADLGECNTVKI